MSKCNPMEGEKLPQEVERNRITATPIGTRATADTQIVATWLDGMGSDVTRRNFARTAERFLEALRMPLREAKLEDVRDALEVITTASSDATAKQYALRVKSLLTFAHKLGYLPFNAGTAIKVKVARRSVAKRIVDSTAIGLLIRAAKSRRDRALIQVAYAGGLRVSEVVALKWRDVIEREGEQVQLSIIGKGGLEREVLLPAIVSRSLIALRGDAEADEALFRSQKGGHLSTRAVNYMIKQTANAAGIDPTMSSHWLRHSHASHALDKGATLAEVQATLGHANVATTSTYLHARPRSSSGLALDEGVFLR